jgi:murein DD-endopeptidase MepM/ murein hydrolase activator NlpD
MIPEKAIKPIRKNGRDNTEIAVGTLIAYRVFPHTQEGIQKAKDTIAANDNWLVPSLLPEYYDGIDSDLMVGKENDAIRAITRQLKEFYGISSAGTETAEDTKTPIEPEPVEEIKKPQQRNVNHPKLYPELQKFIKPRYMWGQRGLYDLNFKSDIDKAIYYAGASSKNKQGDMISPNEKKLAIREWIFAVTGLNYRDDYDELKEYRKRILEYIVTGLRTDTIEDDGGELIIPPIYDGPFDEPNQEEDYDEEEEDEEEPEGLDDLLDFVKVEEELPEEKEVAENIEEQIVDAIEADDDEEGDIGSEDDIPDELLQDELDPEFVEQLVVTVNKRKNKPRKPRTGSYVTNTKIFKFLTTNLYKIQGQLDSIDKSLQEQTQLVQANLQVTSGIYENLDIQNEIIGQKLDAILQVFNKQTEISKQFAEDEERRLAEQRLENQVDIAGTETPADLRGKGATGKKRQSKISQYYRRKLLRQAYRKLPKKLRSLRTETRRLQKIPGKISAGIKSSAANRITRILPKKVSNFTNNLRASRAAAQGMGGVSKLKGVGRNIPGIRQALSALEYSERKSAGQSEVQAIAGVGGSLAGAAAGAALGTMLFPGVGTVAGLLIGAAFSAAGSMAGSKIADISTGADKINGEHEVGGLTKPGTAILHGTEAIVDQNIANMQPVDPVGGTILAATTQYINKLGPIGAPIAPMFEQVAAPLAKVYDVPSTLVQANVGGSLPSLQSTIKKVRDKKKKTPEEKLGAIEKDLLETKDPESFADKLLKMLDPEGKFQQLLKNINATTTPTIDGDSLMAEGGYAVEASDVGDKFGDRGGKHRGIDIASSRFTMGTPISIIKPGTVVDVGRLSQGSGDPGGWGNFVVVKHDDGLYSLYGHLSEINAAKGQRLEPSSAGVFPVIGKIGSTGRSTGAHLHLEVGTGWSGGVLTGHMNPLPIVNQLLRGGGNVKKIDRPTGTPVKVEGLGQQGIMGNKNLGQVSGVGNKGYLIVPGHGAGGGAPEEKRLVQMLAQNAYTNLKAKHPNANIQYVNPDTMFGDDDAGWNKQKEWYKQKEKEGWEILEVHMDASMESKQGKGRGVITSKAELNPVEKYFGENYGAFDRGFRDLALPNRGGSIFELGNMSPELQQLVKSGKVSKEQLNALTAPFESSIAAGLNLQQSIAPPTQRQPAQSKYYLRQGADKKTDTQIIMIPASSNAGKALEKNATTEGVRFSYNKNYNTFDTSEIPSSTRALVLRRLGLN